MERCPNCGSSVRTGAKFCTTCGFRLPLPASPEPPTPGRRSPFDTTSSDTVLSRWADPGPPAAPEPEAAVKQTVAPPRPPQPATAEPEPPEPVARPVVSSGPADSTPGAGQGTPPLSGWGAYGTGFGPRVSAWGTGPRADDTPLPVYHDIPPAPPDSTRTVEDAVAAWSAGRDLSAPEDSTVEADSATRTAESDEPTIEAAAADEEPALRSAPAAGQWAWPPEDVAETAAEQPASATEPEDNARPEAAPVEHDAVSPEAVEELAAVAADEDAGVATTEPARTDEVAPMPAPEAAARESDPAVRAAALVAELQQLLPRLTARPAAADVDLDAVIGTLAESLAAAADEQETFARLRAAVATAQARPRDVDVMLDLVARAGAMASVLEAHDRYRSAIERAVKELRGEQDEAPAPRW